MATIVTSRGIQDHKIVSSQEWLASRQELLNKEKELTRLRDELARQRRELPWEKVDKQYVFDGPNGQETLADLFGGKSQLIVYHFMFGPEWKQGCSSCSLVADHFDPSVIHLAQRDVTLLAVSRAPWAQIEPFQKRMGWSFKWVSSFANDFNWEYNVSFSKDDVARHAVYYNYTVQDFPGGEEAPGMSVFYKDPSGNIFHTYSTFGRGAEAGLGVYNFLDMAPKGRDEEALTFPMAWVRHHDRYEGVADAKTQKKEQDCCAV